MDKMNKKLIFAFAITFLASMIFQSSNAAQLPELAYLIEIEGTSLLPSTIYAGDAVSLSVNIKNRGTVLPIVDLNGVLDIGNQFEPIDLEDNIAVIKPSATKTLIFRFRVKDDTLPGHYPVFLTMTYLRNNEVVKETQSIIIPVSRTQKNIDVTIEPKVISPGKQTQMLFTLKNVGDTPVSNISFSWSDASNLILPLGSDNKRFVSILQPGQQETVSYIVAADPNITTGIYPLNISITFNDINGLKTQTSQVGLIVGGTTDFEVSAELLSTGQLSMSIANIGSNNAGAVVVKIPSQQGIQISGSNVAILGNLNKGDFTMATFQIRSTISTQTTSATSGTPSTTSGFRNTVTSRQTWQGQANQSAQSIQDSNAFSRFRAARDLIVEIEYTDTTGERQKVQKTVQLIQSASDIGTIARERQSTGQLSLNQWVILALIIAGAIVFNKYRAKKGWKKMGLAIVAVIAIFVGAESLFGSNLQTIAIAGLISIGVFALVLRKNETKK